MSFFTKLFKKNNSTNQQEKLEEEDIRKNNEGVSNSDLLQANGDIVYIRYGTGMPIEAIYAYIERDYEQQGYDDAICNTDSSYKESKKTIIRSGLKRLFEQVSLRYKNDLREIDVQIQLVEQQGMLNTVSSLQARKETYLEHLKIIGEMENALENNNAQLLSMLDSYERGFLRGLAAITQSYLKGDNKA